MPIHVWLMRSVVSSVKFFRFGTRIFMNMDVTNDEHTNEVLRGLNKLRKRAELTDVVLEVEGRCFPCHRAVLASCSPYFRTMFTSGYAEAKQERISIQDVSGVAMATILDYAYTGRLQTEPDQVQAVMSAARLLQVSFVDLKAAEYMKEHLDLSNCADVLMYADMLGDCGLVEASGRYIAFRFNDVALQPSFLQLPLSLLQSLLNREDLITNSEDDVVQAALRWIGFNEEERLQHLPAICRCFRHSFISSNQRVELESKCPSANFKLVYSDSTTQRLGQKHPEMQIFPRLVREGFKQGQGSLRCAPCYDPSTGELYAINMPSHLRRFSMTATPDDELYLAGGITGISIRNKTFYQYNHLLNTWEPRCDMLSQRIRCGLVYVKGYIYAIGGDDGAGTAERYDPSHDRWTPLPPIPRPMSSKLCAVAFDDSIYVISRKGCYCFSTTENTWNMIADMITPPLRPQAISYGGSIYCIDCDKEENGYLNNVEVYNPTKGEWKLSGNGSFPFEFDIATLVKYGETMYLITGHNYDQYQYTNPELEIISYQYEPETDSWLYPDDSDSRVPPLSQWMGSERIDCLTARMMPMCLMDSNAYKDLEVPCYDEEDSVASFSESPGSGVSDNSDSDLSDREDNSDEDRESGSFDGDI
ncbi:kelch repeat and BTB domain-containing protein 2-like isoform X1 [Branchiostoma lanceolatum]|uniref:kelch repeat and BTB domain-containing protein 2-like isoform X1 n=1 Tax=Branchiostoma lanceolatum TaxID=7740 RepID=UPI003451D692